MEIHFYEDESACKNCIHGWSETVNAISSKQPIIRTTQMGLLGTYLFQKGYRIFLGDDTEIKLGINKCTDREIKEGHDLFRLWKNSEFDIKEKP